MKFNPAPRVTEDCINRHKGGGYSVRVACMIDGFPGEVEITLDEDHRRYSSGDVSVFDPVNICWRTVYSLPKHLLAELPILPDTPDGLAYLQNLASTLYSTGANILIAARVRQYEVDAERAAAEERAKVAIRDEYFAAQTAKVEAARSEVRPERPRSAGSVAVGDREIPVDIIHNTEEETAK